MFGFLTKSATPPPPHLETNATSRLEEELVHAQNTAAMLEQEIAIQREECTALRTQLKAVKEDNAIRSCINIALSNGKRTLEARYKDLLTNNNELVAHNHDLNVQNYDLSVLNKDLMQLVRDLETRNEHLERENVNWKDSFRAIYTPPRPVLHPCSAPETVSSPIALHDRLTAAENRLADLNLVLSHKESHIKYLKEEVGDFEAEMEWRDEMIRVVEEELAEVKGLLEWYKGCVDDMGRWALWEGEGLQGDAVGWGGEESEWEEGDEGWEGSESEFEEVVVRDFDGVEEGGEDLGAEWVEVV
jgi:DNA repair exonuclease SbcCD ATPase subunit